MNNSQEKASKQRFAALDVFRGATVAFMILVNNPGSWSTMFEPLKHASWHGCTPTDLVFPFFLFAVGNALAFVLHVLRAEPDSSVWFKIVRRTMLIFAIGMFLNAFPFVEWSKESGALTWKDFSTFRFLGVLQRIALCFGAAAILVRLLARDGKTHRILLVSASILLLYWLLCSRLGTPIDPFSLEGFYGTAIDRAILGEKHLYRGEGVPFDPEGLVSTLPAIVQVLLGWWVGQLVVCNGSDLTMVQSRMFVVGIYLLTIAYIWQWVFPINKKIWTSTFVLHTSGFAMLTLGVFLQWLDLKRSFGKAEGKGESSSSSRMTIKPLFSFLLRTIFEPFGKNPLFIFVLSGMVPRLLGLFRWPIDLDAKGNSVWTSPLPWAYKSLFSEIGSDPRLGSFLYSVALLSVYWLIAYGMDRAKVYIRV
jgi:predicted acyltransferase